MAKNSWRRMGLALTVLALSSLACGINGNLFQTAVDTTGQQFEATANAYATERGVGTEALQATLYAAMTESAGLNEDIEPAMVAAMTEAAITNDVQPTRDAAMTFVAEATEYALSNLNRQWATGASASTQYGDDGWSASQTTGVPDVYPYCGDFAEAWASESPNDLAVLTLTYGDAVIPTQINIYQTYYPGAISQVRVMDASSQNAVIVYTAIPHDFEPCPSILTIEITGVIFPVSQVEIILDQSGHKTQNQIDAVELVGWSQ